MKHETFQDSRKSGFTLIELLITVAILAVVAAVGSVNLFNYYSRQNLSLTVDEIIAFLRDAQNRSLTQESGDQWGVHFSNATTTNFQLFHGLSFASSTLVANRDLHPGVQFIAPAVGSSTDVIFSKITGYPNASTSIIVALKSNPTQAYTIIISAVGQVVETFGTIVTVPGVPSGLVASPGFQQITLNWNAPASDGGSLITNYKIYRGNSPGGESYLKTLGNVLTDIDTGLTDGITYYYQVSAVNDKGEGLKSDEISAVSGDTTPPIAGSVTPSNISYGSYVDTPFDLSTVFTDNESAVTSCQYTINGGTNWYAATVSGTGPGYTCSQGSITSSNGTVLTLNMRATSSGGTTTATPISRTVDGLAPSDGVLTATPSDGQVSLSWTAATDSGSGLATDNTYELVFSTSGSPAVNCTGDSQIYLGTGTSYNHNVSNGTTYYYRVCASDAVNNISTGAIANATPVAPAPPGRYWVGGTGNWSDTAHWSVSPGGAGGASVPTLGDDVYFNANSFPTTGQIITINATANAKNMNWTGVANNPTFAGSSALNIAGSLTLVSGMTRSYTGTMTFVATSTGQTITLAGKTLGGSVTFNGSGGGWTFQDAFSVGTATITLTSGSLNTNSQTVTCGTFSSSNSNIRTLTLGSSSITCSTAGTAWSFATVTGLTFNAGTSQIILSGSTSAFSGGGLTYYNVSFPAAGDVGVTGTNTFNNLNRTGTAAGTYITLGANQTISGLLTLQGNSSINRLLARSGTLGTLRTLTAAAVSLTNVDFQDITGAGAAVPFSGTSLGDALGNSNINFTPVVTRYWVGNGGSWNSTTKWSDSSGGASGASVPLPQDTVIFDANSITSTGQTITVNMPRLGKNINFSAVINNPILSFGSTPNTIFGSLTLGSSMTISGTQGLTFSARSPVNLTSSGRTFTNAITIDALGGTITLQDTFNSNSALTLTRGTLTANNQNITALAFTSSNSNTRTINMGSGIWTLTGIDTVWNTSTAASLTLNANTSSIIINNNSATAKTFAGGSRTFYGLRFTNTGTGALTITGSNTFNNLTIDTAPKSVNFTAATTQTVNGNFTANGSAGNLITLRSTTSGSKWNMSVVGTANTSYVDVKDSNGTGAGSPFSCPSLVGSTDFSDGFEDGTIDPFTTDGSANWGATTSTVNSGVYSAKAGTITHSQSTNIYLAQTIGTGGRILSFARRVSSESCCDFLRFYIDGVQAQPAAGSQWAGTVNWGNVNFWVPAGSHTFKWTYSKDGSVSTGSDTAWVDDVTIKDIDNCIDSGNNTGWSF